MKIAIVHDYIKEYGGAERVLEEFIKLFPSAVIYTSLYAPKYLGPHRARFRNYKIKTSFLQYLPFKEKFISIFRLISPFVFRGFDFSEYDVIIVSQTGAYFPNAVRKRDAKLICYTHTPPRYLYGYMTAREWKKNIVVRILGELANHFLRMVDYKTSTNVDYFIANSEEVKARIQKFYRREAAVIYPPVDLNNIDLKTNQENFYLAGGRLARSKGIDVIVKAFNKNGLPLKIFGKGFAGFEEDLKRIAHKNIEFAGEVTDEEKFILMSQSKAFMFASYDEDFGITPLEAMGVGTPVIAFYSGGVKETVVDGKTGLFYSENTPESLNSAVAKFQKIKILPDACKNQAKKFSARIFDSRITNFIQKHAGIT